MQVQQAMANKLRNTILNNWKRYYDVDNITLQRNKMKGIAPNTPIEAGLYQLNKQIGEMEEIIRTAMPNENAEQARSRQQQAVQRLFNILETKHNELTKSGLLDGDKHGLSKLLDRFPELKTFIRNNVKSKMLDDIKNNPNIDDDLKQQADVMLQDREPQNYNISWVEDNLNFLLEDIQGKVIPEKEMKMIEDVKREISGKQSITNEEESKYIKRLGTIENILTKKGIIEEKKNIRTPDFLRPSLTPEQSSSTTRNLLAEFKEDDLKTYLEMLVDGVRELGVKYTQLSNGEPIPRTAETVRNRIKDTVVQLARNQGVNKQEMEDLISDVKEYRALLENTLNRIRPNQENDISGTRMKNMNNEPDNNDDDNQQPTQTSNIPSHRLVPDGDDNFQAVPVSDIASIETKKRLEILDDFLNLYTVSQNPAPQNIKKAKDLIQELVNMSKGNKRGAFLPKKQLDGNYKEFIRSIVSPFKSKLTREANARNKTAPPARTTSAPPARTTSAPPATSSNTNNDDDDGGDGQNIKEKKEGNGRKNNKRKASKTKPKRKAPVSKRKGKGPAVSFIPEGIRNF